jgi:diguanylate cyclase (GGDEF)-like protein
VLLWQARVRIAVALSAGVIALGLLESGVLSGSATALAAVVAAYVIVVASMRRAIQRSGIGGDIAVGATILCDTAFVFAFTMTTASAGGYYRILLLSFVVLHLTESYFGRRYAALAFTMIVGGYGGLVAGLAVRGHPVNVGDELWSLAVFFIVSLAFLVQYGSVQRRLGQIVELFEAAEQGDFTRSYDLAGDRMPDAVTRVGGAYNRVRVQLASMVLTDPLTGCLNRRGLDQALAREVARSMRAGSEMSLVAIDLDHFKNINDTYGHIAGDEVLRELGGLLVQTARAGDTVARTGGEEFSILLPDTEPAGAYRAGTRLCESVRNHDFRVNGARVQVTISVGVVSMSAGTEDGAAGNLKERADEALYAAKRGGRDRVRVWNDALATIDDA